jgi:hypothetical protein
MLLTRIKIIIIIIIIIIIVHNHDVDSTLSRQMFSNSVKRGAAENPSEKPSKIICRQLHQDQYKDMACVRRNMYEERRSVYATIPKTQEDVITTIKSMELTTNKGENFLLLTSEVNRIIIFSCFTNLYFLCQVDNIYVDGTFQYCSKHFFQTFTLHDFKNGHYVPLIFLSVTKQNCRNLY